MSRTLKKKKIKKELRQYQAKKNLNNNYIVLRWILYINIKHNKENIINNIIN